jgi:hypothetical protein
LMITCRALMLLCRACVGSNLIYVAKYVQEIKFQKLFPLFSWMILIYEVWPDWKLNSEFNIRHLTIVLSLGIKGSC